MFNYVNDCPCGLITRGKDKGKKQKRTDCVIRAFQMAWNLKGEDGWRIAAERLFIRSLTVGDVQVGDETWHSFVKQSDKPRYQVDKNGRAKWFTVDGKRQRKYYTIKEFTKLTKDDPNGYICYSAHHLTFVKGGKYFDSCDSGNCPVRSSWILKEA